MNRTTNYKLCQWERSDKVLMEDFNEDNAKLDAAIKGQANALEAERAARISAVQAARDACPLVVLRSVTLTASAPRYDLSLTGFSWDDYGEIIIYALLKSEKSHVKVSALLNNRTGSQLYSDSSSNRETLRDFDIYPSGFSAVCRILRSTGGFECLWTDNFYWKGTAYAQSRNWYLSRDEYTAMNFVCTNSNDALAAGTRFTILGIRA